MSIIYCTEEMELLPAERLEKIQNEINKQIEEYKDDLKKKENTENLSKRLAAMVKDNCAYLGLTEVANSGYTMFGTKAVRYIIVRNQTETWRVLIDPII